MTGGPPPPLTPAERTVDTVAGGIFLALLAYMLIGIALGFGDPDRECDRACSEAAKP